MAAVQTTAPKTKAVTGFRPEIQGLRALAIAVVLLFHLWPNRVTGGFVGVDVFFVISGYLITGHLYKELVQTGSIKLGRFWARRIRRLLPLALTVLFASFLAMLFLMPGTTWSTNIRHIMAATLYMENWALAFDAVDYLAQTDEGNLVTHYWSLSIEEQFYVFLPLLLLASVLIARVMRDHRSIDHRVLAISVLTALAVLSLTVSIVLTGQNQAEAYFVTPTRMWEFALGGLTALIGVRIGGKMGDVLGWLGVAMIVVAAFWFTGSSLFPGYIALLPVIGAILLICCGSDQPATGVYWWASSKPAQLLGDWSYAVYLWHWPLIVIAQYNVEPFLWYHKVGVLAASIVLGWGSKHLIEDPVRFAPAIQRTGPSVVMMIVGMAVVAGTTWAVPAQINAQENTPTLSQRDECYAAGALTNHCEPLEGESGPYPNPATAMAQNRDFAFVDCQAAVDAENNPECVLGESGNEEPNAVIIGDSHASAWLPLIDRLGREHGLRFKTFTRSGCTPIDLERAPDQNPVKNNHLCTKHVEQALEYVRAHETVKHVFFAASPAKRSYRGADGSFSMEHGVTRLVKIFEDLTRMGKIPVAFEEIPRFEDKVPVCLEKHQDNPMACAKPAGETFGSKRFLASAVAESKVRVPSVSVRDQICDDELCYPVLGTVMTYRDGSHLTDLFVESLYPVVEQRLSDQGVFTSTAD